MKSLTWLVEPKCLSEDRSVRNKTVSKRVAIRYDSYSRRSEIRITKIVAGSRFCLGHGFCCILPDLLVPTNSGTVAWRICTRDFQLGTRPLGGYIVENMAVLKQES